MLETKRKVIGQMIVCCGCCCGATHKGRPEVPVEFCHILDHAARSLKTCSPDRAGARPPARLESILRHRCFPRTLASWPVAAM